MKFKNYKNPHTNDNRIYSHSDIYNMPLGEVFKRKDELLAQYRVLGAPKESELKNSENVVYVEAYTRSDGTEVKAHWRSKPGGGSSTGQAADINNKDNTQEKTQESKKVVSQQEDKQIFTKPVEGKITSDFGYRKAPTAGASTGHSGIDIGVPIGTPVKSIADGTVVAAKGGMSGYGNGVFIDHGMINGKHVVSEYGHLSQFEVKVGDKVKQGQIVAKSGNTGVSTGPHLHITIRENKTPVDPKKYLKGY